MDGHPSLFRDRSHRPVSLHGSLFQRNKKSSIRSHRLPRYCCSSKHHKAIPDRLLFHRVARLFTDALRGFLHCRPCRSSLCIAVTISQAITECNLGRHFRARVSCVEGNMIILRQRRHKSRRARLDFMNDLVTFFYVSSEKIDETLLFFYLLTFTVHVIIPYVVTLYSVYRVISLKLPQTRL